MVTLEQLDLKLGWRHDNEQGVMIRNVSDKAFSWTRDKVDGSVTIRFSNLYITYFGRQFVKQSVA